jgi:lipopolysaccharide exporter
MRGIGFASTLILVRLLAPEDFGLLAMCFVIIGLTEVLFEFGIEAAIIQIAKLTDAHLNTAWTIRIVQSLLVAGILTICAPIAGAYYNDDRVTSLLPLIALGLVIRGFSNIGLVLLRRELQFRREAAYGVVVRVITFFLNVGLAWYLGNYWALVIANIFSNVIACIFSYWAHPYRPRASMEKLGEIWSFSQWMLILHIANYTSNQIDQLIIGARLGAQSSGIYAVSTEIAELPTTELIFPISRVLFPGFAKLRSEPDRLKHAFLNALGFLATFSVPACIGVALVAERLVPLLLGEKWNDAIPIIQILAVFSVFRTLFGLPGNLLVVIGHVRLLTIFTFAQLILFLGGAWFLSNYGLAGIAVAKAAAAALFLFLLIDRLAVLFPITRREILSELVRPVMASGAMIAALLSAAPYLPDENLFAVIAQVLLGVFSYSLALLAIWQLAGCKEGTETFLLGHVRNLVSSRTNQD